jgi:hypothetical protein
LKELPATDHIAGFGAPCSLVTVTSTRSWTDTNTASLSSSTPAGVPVPEAYIWVIQYLYNSPSGCRNVFDVPLIFMLTDDEKALLKDGLVFEDTLQCAMDNATDIITLGFDVKRRSFTAI